MSAHSRRSSKGFRPSSHRRRSWSDIVIPSLFVLFGIILLFTVDLIGKKKVRKGPPAQTHADYRMPDDFTLADVERMMDTMRSNKEFQYYFDITGPAILQFTVHRVYEILKVFQKSTELSSQIDQIQQNIETSGTMIAYLDLSDQFIADPDLDPALKMMIEQFFQDSFLSAVISLYYKAKFDNGFTLKWSPATLKAADKVRPILTRWKSQ